MGDPSLPEGAIEVAKLGGAGVGGSLLSILMARLFGGQDKVLARLDVLQASVTEVQKTLAVVVATSERRDVIVARLESQMTELQQRVAGLEAKLEQASEGILR